MEIRAEKWLKKVVCVVLGGVSLLAWAAQEPGVDQAQAYFEVEHERDEKAEHELREWLLDGVPEEFGGGGRPVGDQLGEQEHELLELPEGERFMASSPRQLITPASLESLSGDCADGEESSASRERFGGQNVSRSASRDGSRNSSGSGSEDGGSEYGDSMRASIRTRTSFVGFRNNGSGYAADLDNQGRRLTKPRLIKQEKAIAPAELRAREESREEARKKPRAQSWTYAQSGVGQQDGQQAYREPTNDHRELMKRAATEIKLRDGRARMELAAQEMRDSYSN